MAIFDEAEYTTRYGGKSEIPTAKMRTSTIQDIINGYMRWFTKAKPGWRIEYHYGYLVVDRGNDQAAHLLGNLFQTAAQLGLVELSQYRGEPGHYSYQARRVDTGHLTLCEHRALEAAIQPGDE